MLGSSRIYTEPTEFNSVLGEGDSEAEMEKIRT
jgi:hypothetical protein